MAELNQAAAAREALEKQYGKVWNSDELRAEFEPIGFMAPKYRLMRASKKKSSESSTRILIGRGWLPTRYRRANHRSSGSFAGKKSKPASARKLPARVGSD